MGSDPVGETYKQQFAQSYRTADQRLAEFSRLVDSTDGGCDYTPHSAQLTSSVRTQQEVIQALASGRRDAASGNVQSTIAHRAYRPESAQ